jgi:glycine dehydrogenase subunit 1
MYIPHTNEDREAMLRAVGVKRIEDLFQDVPAAHRFPDLKLPSGLTEMEVMSEMKDIAAANESVQDLVCFLGAGAYNHYIPPVVDAILRRGEFYTAYTPYQPEISQGTLQAIFDCRAW